MFTGLIEEVATVKSLKPLGSNLKISIAAKLVLEDIKLGDSIAINGVCLTVTDFDSQAFSVEAVKETLNVTALKNLKVGDLVNLERCLRAEDRLGGHIVQGHVDTVAECINIVDQQGSYDLHFRIDTAYSKYIINKGSISISGISLTVVKIEADTFYVSIIPATWQKTNLSQLQQGDLVNIEVDVLAKYLEKMSKSMIN
jgi:riboflavin synthase